MTPVAITCGSCGSQAPEARQFCPSCGAPLRPTAAVGTRSVDHAPVPVGLTDTWDAILPRLQEALFGEFVLSRELGRGGMAAVFLAHQLKLHRQVAIKVMAPTLMSGAGLADRFRDEATTVARLDHPNIISIYGIGSAAGLEYFIMQYVAGRSLERVLRQYERLPVAVVRAILFEVGSALAHAHRHEVIHRDVKPGNVLLSLDGRVIVGDFGIAKVAASSARTQTGAVVGTPAYMSPEQCWGRTLTWSADQYALGIVAFEMLTGAPPFTGTAYAVMRGHTEEPVPDLLLRRPDCPPDMADAIRRMLSKRPEDRFPSMSAALSALGASRTAVDDAAQAIIGHLAIRLRDEEGVVLVHTPESPIPQQEPHATPAISQPSDAVLTGRPPLRDRLAALARAAAVAIAPIGRALAARSMGAAAAVRGIARSIYARTVSTPRRVGIAAGSVISIGAVIAAALLARTPSRAVGPRPTAPRTDTSVTQSTGTVAAVDSAIILAPPDSAPRTQPDSLTAPADSSAPGSLTFTRVASRILEVGDSAQLDVVVRDFRKNRVENPDVVWSVSDSTRLIRTPTGWLRARAPGFVRVNARIDTLRRSIQFNVIGRSVQRTGEADAGRREQTASSGADPALEEDAIHRAVTTFIESVLNGRDIERIKAKYLSSGPSDVEGRDAFIAKIGGRRNVTVHGQQDPPPPTIAGTRASASTRITRTVRRSFGRDESEALTLYVELTKSVDGWNVSGFRVSPAGAIRQ